MSKPGRNAPCPCGSGKKYKKCCLARDRRGHDPPAREPLEADPLQPSPPRAGRAPQSRSSPRETILQFERSLARIWRQCSRQHNQAIGRHGLSAFSDVAIDGFGYNPDRCDELGYLLLTALTFFSNVLVADAQADLQRRIEVKLKGRQRLLYSLLRSTPLQVWEADRRGPDGLLRGRPLLGPDSQRWRPLAAVLNQDGPSRPGIFVGWPIVYGGWRIFALAIELQPQEARRLRELAEPIEHEDSTELWAALQASIVDAVVAPSYEEGEPDVAPFTLEDYVNTEALRALILSRAARYQRGEIRVLAARARKAADLDRLVTILKVLRRGALPPPYQARHVDDSEIAALLPVTELLSHYGLNAEAEINIDGVIPFERQPIALLGLSGDLLDRAHLDGQMPLSALADWATTRAREPDRRIVEAAIEGFRSEQRWLATIDASCSEGANLANGIGYDTAMRAFGELFDPALGASPVTELGLDKRALSRFRSAWERADDASAPTTLARMPRDAGELCALKGVGRVTVAALAEALLERARNWRLDRAGLDRKRLAALARRAPESAQELRGGLEELAALFG